jgi:hypothetical protein
LRSTEREREREREREGDTNLTSTCAAVEDEGAVLSSAPTRIPFLEAASLAATSALWIGLEVDEEAAVVNPPPLASTSAPSRAAARNPRKFEPPRPHHGRDGGKRGGEWERIGLEVSVQRGL